MSTELITVGLSEVGNAKLDYMKEQGLFAEKIDGYRFAVGLAIACGAAVPPISKRKTFVNVGSLDPDQKLRIAVESLFPEEVAESSAYRYIERLADWGVRELHAQAQKGDIDFVQILHSMEASKEQP